MAIKRSGDSEDREGAARGGGTSRGAEGAAGGGAAKKAASGAGAAAKKNVGGSAKKSTGATAKKSTAGAAKQSATGSAKKRQSPGARKTAATGRSGSTGATGTKTAKRTRPDLRSALRDFASGRPQGWNHEDWMSFLQDLQARGHNIDDREAIGRALERERLDMTLERVGGVGPKPRKALVERYETVWSLRNADADQIAQVGNISREDAEQVRQALQQ